METLEAWIERAATAPVLEEVGIAPQDSSM
jgi:hypothetical protein